MAKAVAEGRQIGMSWAEIGKAIGMTGQGAGKRYGRRAGAEADGLVEDLHR